MGSENKLKLDYFLQNIDTLLDEYVSDKQEKHQNEMLAENIRCYVAEESDIENFTNVIKKQVGDFVGAQFAILLVEHYMNAGVYEICANEAAKDETCDAESIIIGESALSFDDAAYLTFDIGNVPQKISYIGIKIKDKYRYGE